MTPRSLGRIGLAAICALIAAMWLYAFVFASRESANKIGDDAWKERSEAHCRAAADARTALTDNSPMDPNDPDDLRRKADIVDRATDSLATAIDAIAADVPADEKGRALVPLWVADYRTYISDRRAFAEALRNASHRPYFAETEVEGVPISEKIGKFARENSMRSCQPPYDLSI